MIKRDKKYYGENGMKINLKAKGYFIYIGAFVIIVLLMLLTVLGWRYYVRKIEGDDLGQQAGGALYDRHYVMIPDDAVVAECSQKIQSVLNPEASTQTSPENTSDATVEIIE